MCAFGSIAYGNRVLFIGDDLFGARRSFFKGSIQPGEMAKLAVIIYIAAWLASKGDQVRNVAYGLVPFTLLVGVVVGLIVLQPDLSMVYVPAILSLGR